ncbi:helix-turn-helix domain-containing protein [Vineibacter terrae]|uniref:helix-turn-helix domain-containing protein n=1 Tax=Vineibacter terrae TaxID=2586908 RepID=UPI002E346AC5|nr:helix-turn-helix domain-containing protein [Vineibacter terrae]HEX2884911.1 helix-turn-helix domain-containing protein [Vineibacter terrae]
MAFPLRHEAVSEHPALRRDGASTSSYREFGAGAGIATAAACTWLGQPGWTRTMRVLPDGCADMVWNGDALVVARAHPVAVRVRLQAGRRSVGLRLRCGAAGAVLGLPACELPAEPIELRSLLGSLATQAEARLMEADAVAAQRAILEDLIAARLKRGHRPDPRILAAVDRLRSPTTRVAMVAGGMSLSTRELRRRFHADIGCGPKTLQGILRFRNFMRQAEKPPAGRGTVAMLAASCGYADQAHLSRDCKRLAGSTPRALVSGR